MDENTDRSMLLIYQGDDIEKVSFLEYSNKTLLDIKFHYVRATFIALHPELDSFSDDFWEKLIRQLPDIKYPVVDIDHLLPFTIMGKKANQIAFWKEQRISFKELISLLLKLDEMGYLYSQIRYRGCVPNVNKEDLPFLINVEDKNTLNIIGETFLSEGSLRTAVNQTKNVVAKIVEKGEEWHCFYFTFKGVAGREAGEQGGKPHLHYVSNGFGINLDRMKADFKSGNCPHSPIHVEITY